VSAFINDEYVLNPTLDEMADTSFDLVVAGTAMPCDGGIGKPRNSTKISCSAR